MANFPVNDIRKDIDGSWNLLSKSESINVPASSPYVVQLEEIPDNGSLATKPSISGLTITETYPPAANEYYVNYGNGKIAFHSSKSGQNYTVNYYAKGTLVAADHINWLYNNKVDASGSPTAGQIAQFVDSNTIEGVSEIDGGTF